MLSKAVYDFLKGGFRNKIVLLKTPITSNVDISILFHLQAVRNTELTFKLLNN